LVAYLVDSGLSPEIVHFHTKDSHSDKTDEEDWYIKGTKYVDL
jgi:hypothetical protein